MHRKNNLDLFSVPSILYFARTRENDLTRGKKDTGLAIIMTLLKIPRP